MSPNCPLVLHKYQRDLNSVLEAVRKVWLEWIICSYTHGTCMWSSIYIHIKHPYIHPTETIVYLVSHELLVMVQPLMPSGSLKDMIYKVYIIKIVGCFISIAFVCIVYTCLEMFVASCDWLSKDDSKLNMYPFRPIHWLTGQTSMLIVVSHWLQIR